jgi:hypothetical protein
MDTVAGRPADEWRRPDGSLVEVVTPSGLVANFARETLRAGAVAAGTFFLQVLDSG